MAGMMDAILQAARANTGVPMRQQYGQRWNEAEGKLNSPEQKTYGFFGPLALPNGDIASEYSIGGEIGGKQMDYPSISPNLNHSELASALMAALMQQPVPDNVAAKAELSAKQRVSQGKSPFWNFGHDPFPAWSPNQKWGG